jgi:hypothetical protein
MKEKTTQQIIDSADKLLAELDSTNDFQVVHAQDLNARERRGLRAVVRFVRDREAYNGVTSVRFEMTRCQYFVAVTLKTWRSDCGHYSERALMCDSRVVFYIGPRGGLTIKSAECGFGNDSKTHFKKMLRAS